MHTVVRAVPFRCLFLVSVLIAGSPRGSAAAADGHWVQINTAHTPGSRSGAGAAYDANGKRMLIFGGLSGATTKNDVWQLSLGCTPDWTLISTSGAPPARVNSSAAYDPVHNQLVVYGGSSGLTRYGDVWVLSLGGSPTWTRVDSVTATCGASGKPCKRAESATVWNSAVGKMWMSCGIGCISHQDTWSAAVTASTNGWNLLSGDEDCDEQVYTDPSLPEPRAGLSMIYDSRNQDVVVFGGDYEGDPTPSTAWASSTTGQSWTELATPPDPDRMQHTAVYDSSRARMLVYGGDSSTGSPNDSTIVLSLPQGGTPSWSTLHPTGSTPGTMSGHAAIYDPAGDRMIVFATNGNSYALNFDASGPSVITNLSAVFHGANVFLRWTAPGEDGSSGQALCYDMRSSTSEINSSNFDSASPMSPPTPSSGGAKDSLNVTGLADGNTYYFAIKTIDHHGNISGISNVYSFCLLTSPWRFCGGEQLAQNRDEGDPRLVFAINDIYPNPSTRDLRVSFTLPRPGDARIELLDISGRRVRSFDLAAMSAGRHEVNLGEGAPLPGGYYFVRLRQGDASVSRSAAIVR